MTNSTIKLTEEYIKNSIIPIYNDTTSGSQFGTGFVIDKTETSTYILTAYHTIEIGGKPCKAADLSTIPMLEKIGYSEDKKIKASEIIISNKSLDLAVIEFDKVWECEPLPLNLFSDNNVQIKKGISFILSGYCFRGNVANTPFTSIEGKFGNFETIANVNYYYLKTVEEQILPVEDGHSGSPIFDKDKKVVIGVLLKADNEENNQKWLAISINALTKFPYVWSKLQLEYENKMLNEKLSMVQQKENQNHQLLQLLQQEINSLKQSHSQLNDSFERKSQELEQVKTNISNLQQGQIKIKSNCYDFFNLQGLDLKFRINKPKHFNENYIPEQESNKIYYGGDDSHFSFQNDDPEIILTISILDTENREPKPTNTRVEAYVGSKNKSYFTIKVKTWMDSYIHKVRINWIAFGI